LRFHRYAAFLRGRRVRIYVCALVASILLPALLLGGWLVSRSALSERAQVERNLHQKAREVLLDVDQEIVSAMSMLTALASSHFLHTGDFDAFRRQAEEVSQQIGMQIVLLDLGRHEQIINTMVPPGAPLPRGVRPEVLATSQRALNTGKPAVSSVFVGPVVGRPVVSVGLTIAPNADSTCYLAVGLLTDRFAALLERAQLRPGSIAAILDRDNRFVARSQNHADFTGTQSANPPLSVSQGMMATRNRDGTPFRWFFHRSEISHWVMGVGVPESVLEGPLQTALLNYGLSGCVLFVLAMALSYGASGQMARSFGVLGIDRQPSREEFRVLFESAPNGVLLVDHDGVILLGNAWMENKFGYRREELIGRPVELLIPEWFSKRHPGDREAFLAAPEARPMGAGRELYGRRKDGSEFPLEIGLSPINTRGGNLVMATVVDITARKQAAQRLSAAAQALRASEEQRGLAVEAAELGPWSWDLVKDEMWWSDRMRQIIGVPEAAPANHANWYERLHPADRPLVQEMFRRRLSGERYHDYEYRIVRPDDVGSTHWISSKGQTAFDEAGKPVSVLGVIQDITARKAMEHARHDLYRRLQQAREEERMRLSRELHDETGQSLAAVLMELKSLEAAVTESGRERLLLLRRQIEQMSYTLHRVAWELRPASLDELGLATVLADYVSEWGVRSGIEADFICTDALLDTLPEELRTTIYRVVQEGLTNIAKHATGSTCVSVVIERMATELRVTIEDNGAGFLPEVCSSLGPGPAAGLGLAGMRERVALIGGKLEIESSSEGTAIFVNLPMEPERMTA
jgi:PAS domain S-box-containing protein